MREKSDGARPWKDTAVTVTVCLWQPLAPLRPFAAYSYVSVTDAHTLTRTLLLSLIAGLYTVMASYCIILERACTTKGFLTSTACLPGMPLYGQSDQYDTCFIASLLQNIPALSAPILETQSRGLGAPARLLRLSFPSRCSCSSLRLSSQPAW